MSEVASSVFRTLCILALIAIGMGKLGDFFWFGDLFSHWQLQYGVLMIIVFIGLLALRRWIFLALALFILFFITPDITAMLSRDEVTDVQMYFVNAHYTNPDNQKIIDSIQSHEPLLLSVVELSEDLALRIRGLGYLAVYEHFNEYESFGFYIADQEQRGYITDAGVEDLFPYPIGFVKFQDTTIYTIHPYPGLTKEMAVNQEKTFAQVTEMVQEKGGLHVIVGDFNSTPFSQVFQKYFKVYKAKARFTWNVGTPFMLPIDHVLSNIDGLIYKVGEDVGSDHRPLLIDFPVTRQGLFGSGV